jgi:hypothetical protein
LTQKRKEEDDEKYEQKNKKVNVKLNHNN